MAKARAGTRAKGTGTKRRTRRTNAGRTSGGSARRKGTRRRTSGAREARALDAARQIEAEQDAPARWPPSREETSAGPSVIEAGEQTAAELAREIEDAAGAAAEDVQRRAEAASAELGRRREEAQGTARELGDRELPGFLAIGLELLVGALRITRVLAIAPLRIGLAFLRPL